ncbi:hypothetical protein GGS21DRAFT_330254 [Xylaria nigripes]|nr:hypothetical protein GGS21DRAFT_330254 [Xylaria nigripes]
MFQLPEGTLGDAAGVLSFTFICLLTNILLIWLYWAINDHWSYVTLIGYFALLCTVSSIVQQIYNYTYWNDLLWAQLHYIKANYHNADVIFFNGNFGFMRALATVRLFCYLVESTYLLAYCVRATIITSNFWIGRRNRERMFAVAGRTIPPILAAFTISLLQTSAVQSSFTVYLIVANIQSVLSCAISILLLSIVIYRYVQSKLVWKRLIGANKSASLWRRVRDSVSSDNWVVVRLSIAVILISAFIVASIVTYLPQRDDIARDAKASAPDLSPDRARSNIIGYIPGISPGLAIFVVFGFTRDFRQIMYNTFIPRSFRRRMSIVSPREDSIAPPYEMAGVAVDTELQLKIMEQGTKRQESPTTY